MLKTKRIEKGFTQKRLSEATGIPTRTIQHWESFGAENATVKNLMKVAIVLDCCIEELCRK